MHAYENYIIKFLNILGDDAHIFKQLLFTVLLVIYLTTLSLAGLCGVE
jgi:hypothetical protein